ncbi:MAG TPA: urease accessory protein UreE [Gemmatimonadales bacterium]|nr:urease accessory protein UreE [Gemmatimonadales bacterium]
MLRAISHSHQSDTEPFGTLTLVASDRHVRRKLVTSDQGAKIIVDLPEAVLLADGDALVLEDGQMVRIVAAKEELYAVMPGSVPLSHLAWHIGNRHLAAQIDADRILIRRDHVIRAMLEGLGATVEEVVEPFQPVHGAYHSHGHAHDHGLGHGHEHGAHGHHHHD